ncbi:MAG TPA: nucleotide exchange factor GrpE [Micromonosporaceae bacterium]|nr:nucleotide exchange factor GrpE [Micromonosporaceae bacterium]
MDPTGTGGAAAPAGSDAAAGSAGSDGPGAASPVADSGPDPSGQSGPGLAGAGEGPAVVDRSDGRAGAATAESEAPAAEQVQPAGSDTGAPAPAESGGPAGADEPGEAEPSSGDAGPAEAGTEPAGRPLAAELGSLRAELDERTRDLQRLSAEYANYRKRVDRDRGLVAEQTTAHVLSALLPVLDDLDRAREHGDLVGPFGAVAEQMVTAMGKFGLTPFGEKGDPFDPTRHEAVAHLTSAEVTEPTCIEVMRRGYLLGDRLLRPAMVAVADPE